MLAARLRFLDYKKLNPAAKNYICLSKVRFGAQNSTKLVHYTILVNIMQDSSKGVLISIAKITKLVVVSLGIAGRVEIHADCMTLALPDISYC